MVDAVQDYGYDYAFLLSSAFLLGGGIVMFFGLVPKPTDIGLPEPEDLEDDVPGQVQGRNEGDMSPHPQVNPQGLLYLEYDEGQVKLSLEYMHLLCIYL